MQIHSVLFYRRCSRKLRSCWICRGRYAPDIPRSIVHTTPNSWSLLCVPVLFQVCICFTPEVSGACWQPKEPTSVIMKKLGLNMIVRLMSSFSFHLRRRVLSLTFSCAAGPREQPEGFQGFEPVDHRHGHRREVLRPWRDQPCIRIHGVTPNCVSVFFLDLSEARQKAFRLALPPFSPLSPHAGCMVKSHLFGLAAVDCLWPVPACLLDFRTRAHKQSKPERYWSRERLRLSNLNCTLPSLRSSLPSTRRCMRISN